MFEKLAIPVMDINSVAFLHPNEPIILKLVEHIKKDQYFRVGDWIQGLTDQELYVLGTTIGDIYNQKNMDTNLFTKTNFLMDVMMVLLMAEGGDIDQYPIQYLNQLIKIFNAETLHRTGNQKLKWYEPSKVSLLDRDSVFSEVV